MSKKKGESPGRPEAKINWDKVDRLLEAGCNGTEIAAQLGCHRNTLYRQVEDKFDCNFSEYYHTKRSKGDSMLKSKQFEEAMDGDRGMLIWLGKTRLGQVETQHIESSVKVETIDYSNANVDDTDDTAQISPS